MMRKIAWGVVLIAIFFFGFAAWTLYQSWQEPVAIKTTIEADSEPGLGRYVAYDAMAFDDERYATTILFFARTNSEESDAFSGVLSHDNIPAGTQIFRVDVDQQASLATQYEITIPPTFVRVTPDGTAQARWEAYGQTKTIEAILQHLK